MKALASAFRVAVLFVITWLAFGPVGRFHDLIVFSVAGYMGIDGKVGEVSDHERLHVLPC